jgi:cell division septation protein DedD
VQVASLSDKAKAEAMSSKLSGKGYRSRVVKNGDTWKVVVGPELDKTKAQSLKSKINDDGGLGVSGAWVAPWKP